MTDIAELILRRRRQILVHSIIYYKFDDNLIPDSKWAEWALELENLQRDYPEIAFKHAYPAARWPYGIVFENFEHSSGYNLPLDDPWGVQTARKLLQLRDLGYFSKGE